MLEAPRRPQAPLHVQAEAAPASGGEVTSPPGGSVEEGGTQEFAEHDMPRYRFRRVRIARRSEMVAAAMAQMAPAAVPGGHQPPPPPPQQQQAAIVIEDDPEEEADAGVEADAMEVDAGAGQEEGAAEEEEPGEEGGGEEPALPGLDVLLPGDKCIGMDFEDWVNFYMRRVQQGSYLVGCIDSDDFFACVVQEARRRMHSDGPAPH